MKEYSVQWRENIPIGAPFIFPGIQPSFSTEKQEKMFCQKIVSTTHSFILSWITFLTLKLHYTCTFLSFPLNTFYSCYIFHSYILSHFISTNPRQQSFVLFEETTRSVYKLDLFLRALQRMLKTLHSIWHWVYADIMKATGKNLNLHSMHIDCWKWRLDRDSETLYV